MSSSDFANVYASINNLQNQFDEITGNTLSNYNQLSRIVAQQGNIYNSIYFGTGNILTGNLLVNSIANISGNLILNGNIRMTDGNLQITKGNLILSNGDIDLIGNIFCSRNLETSGNIGIGVEPSTSAYKLDIKGTANVSTDFSASRIRAGGSTFFKLDYDSFTVSSNPVTVSFNFTFSSTPRVFFSPTTTSGGRERIFNLYSVSTTQFTGILQDGGGSDQTGQVYYFAIG